MRFMMLMIPLGYETAPPDVKLDPERVAAMMKYNQALKDAGVLITLDGLHPPSMGARVSFAGDRQRDHRNPPGPGTLGFSRRRSGSRRPTDRVAGQAGTIVNGRSIPRGTVSALVTFAPGSCKSPSHELAH